MMFLLFFDCLCSYDGSSGFFNTVYYVFLYVSYMLIAGCTIVKGCTVSNVVSNQFLTAETCVQLQGSLYAIGGQSGTRIFSF